MNPDVCVVLPTYQEATTLPAVVADLRRVLPEIGVVVVDDASPDGTADVARDLGATVVARAAKLGLGSAYVAGFDRALSLGAGTIVQMDADGSHHADDLQRMLMGIRAGADLVLGSRYVPGGAVHGWHPLRRVVSRVGCWYAQAALGVPVRDLTGGFKAWRAAGLEATRFRSVRSRGYAFQVELSYRALRAGLVVREEPIVFSERRGGQSKMTAGIAAEAAWRVPYLRMSVARR